MREYDFRIYSVREKKSKKRFAFFFLLIVISVGFLYLFFVHKTEQRRTLGASAVSEITYLAGKVVGPQNPLEDVVTKSLTGAKGSYSVVIINTKRHQSYALNEHVVYDSASLYKLWIMVVAFEEIQSGQLEEESDLTGDVEELNKKFQISADAAELTEGEVDFTVGSAITQMITISHNYAALLLTEKIGLTNVKKFLSDKGFHESTVGVDNEPPTTTAADIALFFEKLSKGELASPTNTQRMLALLKEQKLNNKLPRYLPEDAVIGHKTGELGMYSHDAGFVSLPKSDYIIVIMSKSDNPSDAQEHIARVSKAVYDYFANH